MSNETRQTPGGGARHDRIEPRIRIPRYLDACVTGVMPTLLHTVGGETTTGRAGGETTTGEVRGAAAAKLGWLAEQLPGVTSVVLVVLDGLGAHLLADHADAAPTLASAAGTRVDACFPTTTSTNLTSIGTGRTPAVHGITGTAITIPGHDRLLISLSWRWDHQFDGEDARAAVVPEAFQPTPTVVAQARQHGVHAATVLRPEFADSGLTRAALRGGTVVAAAGLPATLAAAITTASRSDGRPALVYAHHGDLDAAGHLEGPGSTLWREQLSAADATIAAAVRELPPGCAMVITADHGMVHVPPEGFVELAEAPDLLDGVQLIGGDPRARQLTVEPGAASDVREAWAARTGDAGEVVLRDEAIAAGWFGPTPPNDDVRARIGDVIAVARRDIAWVHRDRDPFGGRLPGQHGSLTDAELEVPVLVFTGGAT